MTKYRVVFHLHEEEKGNIAVSNIINLIKDLGEENINIEMVTNGNGSKVMRKDGGYVRKVDYLLNKGVRLKVCSNSLQDLKIDENDLVDGVESVPSGVGELVKKQAEGWSYIKV